MFIYLFWVYVAALGMNAFWCQCQSQYQYLQNQFFNTNPNTNTWNFGIFNTNTNTNTNTGQNTNTSIPIPGIVCVWFVCISNLAWWDLLWLMWYILHWMSMTIICTNKYLPGDLLKPCWVRAILKNMLFAGKSTWNVASHEEHIVACMQWQGPYIVFTTLFSVI